VSRAGSTSDSTRRPPARNRRAGREQQQTLRPFRARSGGEPLPLEEEAQKNRRRQRARSPAQPVERCSDGSAPRAGARTTRALDTCREAAARAKPSAQCAKGDVGYRLRNPRASARSVAVVRPTTSSRPRTSSRIASSRSKPLQSRSGGVTAGSCARPGKPPAPSAAAPCDPQPPSTVVTRPRRPTVVPVPSRTRVFQLLRVGTAPMMTMHRAARRRFRIGQPAHARVDGGLVELAESSSCLHVETAARDHRLCAAPSSGASSRNA